MTLNDPERWRIKAEQTRALAHALGDSKATKMMLEIAEGYERLAQRAAARRKETK